MDCSPVLPIPISYVGGKYLLFSVEAFSYLRREHRICGMLIGTIPQSPSQNVFLGLPVQLMSEEVQLLVTKGVASVVDDKYAHVVASENFTPSWTADYVSALEEESQSASEARLANQQQRRRTALQKQKSKPSPNSSRGLVPEEDALQTLDGDGSTPVEETVFESQSSSPTLKPLSKQAFRITPATSAHLLPNTSLSLSLPVETTKSFPLFRHLHDKGYYISPGLRFGCQYTVYPGDPLRFHSHFLANGTNWDEENDLMDLVGGGRLGTGVKKGYLIGGQNPKNDEVRTFSIEWAAM